MRCRPATVSEDRGGAGSGLSGLKLFLAGAEAVAVVFTSDNTVGRRACD